MGPLDDCQDLFPELSLTYMHASQPSLVSHHVHSSLPSWFAHALSEPIPIASNCASTLYHLKPALRSRQPPMQWSQCRHASGDFHIIGCHVADHVTDMQQCTTQATSSAYLGLEGSNPRFPHSISNLPFADAPSAPQDCCAQPSSRSRSEALYMRPCSSFLLRPSFLPS